MLARQVSNSYRSDAWHVTPACVYELIMFVVLAG